MNTINRGGYKEMELTQQKKEHLQAIKYLNNTTGCGMSTARRTLEYTEWDINLAMKYAIGEKSMEQE